jgi:hypothetical protein
MADNRDEALLAGLKALSGVERRPREVLIVTST